jgi:hypothetical protein
MELKLHANARTTPNTRAYIQNSGKSVAELADELGVSETTIRRWKNRNSVLDRSPSAPPSQTLHGFGCEFPAAGTADPPMVETVAGCQAKGALCWPHPAHPPPSSRAQRGDPGRHAPAPRLVRSPRLRPSVPPWIATPSARNCLWRLVASRSPVDGVTPR